jgi:hypothetical protein
MSLHERMTHMKRIAHMRRVLAVVVLPLLFTIPAFAQEDTVVAWNRVVGLITSPGVSNPIAGIPSDIVPWTTSGGFVFVDSESNEVVFSVEGLVQVGGEFSGTTGTATRVFGSLVCNVGKPNEAYIQTGQVPLDARGNAYYSGVFLSSVPNPCNNPLFQIIAWPERVWIATGAARFMLTALVASGRSPR